jgi:hypothetical protein
MTLFAASPGQKKQEPQFDQNPEIIQEMPVRPYTVLHEPLPFYSDAECRVEVPGARLIVVRSDDPRQTHHPIECMPTRKTYAKGQTLSWDINHKVQWAESWYVDPDTGNKERAWLRAVEFVGKVVKA